VIALVATSAILGIALGRFELRADLAPIRRRRSSVSFALLLLYAAATLITFQVREDREALFTEGLSAQNRIQVVVVLLAAVWGFFLVTSRRVVVSEAFAGPRVWVTLLLLLYAVAVLWAITPALSLFRVVELSMLWILSLHTFSNPDARRRLLILLIAMVSLGLVSAAVSRGTLNVFGSNFTRSNSLAPIAAALLLFSVDAVLRLGGSPRRVLGVLVSLWLFIRFDSLATTGALVIAGGVFIAWRVRGKSARVVALTVIAAGFVIALLEPRFGPNAMLSRLGSSYGREEVLVTNWTGRVPLWEFMLADVNEHLLGFGLAADRLVSLRDTAGEIGWDALHAHSGFMAAIYAGGPIALFLVAGWVAATYRLFRHSSRPNRSVGLAVVTLLVVNNFTVVGFGGTASPSWLLMMAITVSSGRVFDAGKRSLKIGTSVPEAGESWNGARDPASASLAKRDDAGKLGSFRN